LKLSEIRKQIDGIDDAIISLLAKRAGMVREAATCKKSTETVRDPARVERVIQKVRAKAGEAGLDPDMAEEIYRTVIDCFIRKELAQFGEKVSHTSPKRTDKHIIRKVNDNDREAVIAVFNHYVENSLAAYPDRRVDAGFFDTLKDIVYGDSFYAVEAEGRVIGFSFLKRHHRYAAFDRTAELGYFLLPEYVKKGLGTELLQTLTLDAKSKGIDTLLANIVAVNERSIEFHTDKGFRECGRFLRIGKKFGKDMDIAWMQKFI